MGNQRIKWFDLSSEKASLKLLPQNEHRSAKVCIVFDEGLKQLEEILDKQSDLSLKDAGFDLYASIHMEVSEHETHQRDLYDGKFILYSNNDMNGRLDLKTLQTIFPSLKKDCLIDTYIDQITDFRSILPYENEWKSLFQKHYQNDFQNVWYFTDFDANQQNIQTWPPIDGANLVDYFKDTQTKFNNLGYKSLNGSPMFVDRDQAVRFANEYGMNVDALQQGNFPYALPLQLDRFNNVLYAIPDVRTMTDLIYCDPHSGHEPKVEVEYLKKIQNPIYNLRLNQTLDNAFLELKGVLSPIAQKNKQLIAEFGIVEEDVKDQHRKKAGLALDNFFGRVNEIIKHVDSNKISEFIIKHPSYILEEYQALQEKLDHSLIESNPSKYLEDVDKEYGWNNFIVNGMWYALDKDQVKNSALGQNIHNNEYIDLIQTLTTVSHESEIIETDEFNFTDEDTEIVDTAAPEKAQTEEFELDSIDQNTEPSHKTNAAISQTKIEDVGEKIGGARKDFYKTALQITDLEKFNQRELEALVVKGNVWPSLNYEVMQEMGFEAKAATAIKILKDSIPSQPGMYKNKKYFSTNTDNAEVYITAVSTLRDYLMGKPAELDPENKYPPAKSYLEVLERLQEWNKDMAVFSQDGLTSYGTGLSKFHSELGSKACAYIRPLNFPSHSFNNAIHKLFRQGQKGTYYSDLDLNSWAHLIKKSKTKTDAEKELAQEKKALNDKLHNPLPAHLEVIVSDNKWRDGENISEHQLLDEFKFKGLEFGNWLNQDERQAVVNFAYDSFNDLAEVLDLPKEAISLCGNLSVGFGSRGRGGRNAALAHYEPARKVINLTRIKGAGTLAHEWFHALDDYLGDYAKNYSSEKKNCHFSEFIKSASRRYKTIETLKSELNKDTVKYANYAITWLQDVFKSGQYGEYEKYKAELSEVLQEYFKKVVQPLVDQHVSSKYPEGSTVHLLRTEAILQVNSDMDTIAVKGFELIKARFQNDDRFNFEKLPVNKRDAFESCSQASLTNIYEKTFIDAIEKKGILIEVGAAGKEKTQFLSDAEKLDTMMGKIKPYWATNKEMLARAGACYVSDKLEEMGKENGYLVSGASEDAFKDISQFSPNPQGEDRVRINQVLDISFEGIRERLKKDVEFEYPNINQESVRMDM